MTYAVDVQNLCKNYYQYKVIFKGKLLTKAIKNISFKVKKGDFFGLLGANGAGKSTAISILTTNQTITSGKAFVNGYDVEKQAELVRNQISWSFGSDYEGVGWSSIYKNMMLAAAFVGLNKKKSKETVVDLLKKFDLYEKRHLDVWRMSLGMFGKYSLAVGLMKDPDVLFLDEPLLGLDVETKEKLRGILLEFNDRGKTIIYTSHQLQEVEQFCKNIVIMKQGEIVYDGSLASLKEKYRNFNTLDVQCRSENIVKKLENYKKRFAYVKDYEIEATDGVNHAVNIFTKIPSIEALPKVTGFLQTNKILVDQINTGVLDLEHIFKKIITEESPHHHRLRHYAMTGEAPSKEDIKFIKHKDIDIKVHALMIFFKHHPEKVRKELDKMLRGNKNEMLEAIKIIGRLKLDSHVKHLHKLSEHKDYEIRKWAIISLANFGFPKTIKHIIHLLLEHNHCRDVLDSVPYMHVIVRTALAHHINKLNHHDKEFLQQQIQKHTNSEKLLAELHMHHKSYHEYKRKRGGRQHVRHVHRF